MKPLCDLCQTRHEPYQAHVFASNAASNKVTASNSASNTRGGSKEDNEGHIRPARISAVGGGAVICDVESGVEGSSNPARKQRWSREAYNAYQREYMRKKRAKSG